MLQTCNFHDIRHGFRVRGEDVIFARNVALFAPREFDKTDPFTTMPTFG